jgi:hypothetical protein
MLHRFLASSLAAVVVAALASTPVRSQCSFDWAAGFGQRGLSSGVAALHVCDLGDGPRLYAGGGFIRQNGQWVNHVAKWTGSAWAPLGLGMNADVRTFASASLGSGVSLYAGGNFNLLEGQPSMNVARWNGSAWSTQTSSGSEGGGVAIKAWPGNPAAIYGINGSMLSVTYGGAWQPVASIPGSSLSAIEIFDDGTGPHVYVAGDFTTIGTGVYNRIAKWTGSGWAPLSVGVNDWIGGMTVHDDGTGPALYAGGAFTTAGGILARHIAKWNGVAWSEVGGGLASGVINAIAAKSFGGGNKLVVSGYFSSIGPGVVANSIAVWNGTSWAPLGAGLSSNASAFAVLDEGQGPNLIVGGSFAAAGGEAMNFVARWDGTAWHPMPDGNGFNYGDDREVKATVVWNDGNGPALYCAGNFGSVGNVLANNIVRFDGSNWSALGSGTNGGIDALAVYDDGQGPALYATGGFSTAGGIPVSNIAKWNGTSWSPVFPGIPGFGHVLLPLTTGPFAGTLAVGGSFHMTSPVLGHALAFWNGSTWLSTYPATQTVPYFHKITALAEFDDGSGPALYAGGDGWPNPSCWRYDGTNWITIGTNGGQLFSFAKFDPGTGLHLYAGGSTSYTGPTFSFAELTGTSWTPVPGSLGTTAVRSLAVHQDESGTALYLGGETSVAGVGPAYLRRWDGITFSPLGGGVGGLPWTYNSITPRVDTLASFDSGTGPALYVGGTAIQAGSIESSLIAKWVANRPTIALSQSAPGAGVLITNTGLLPGRTYHNVFSGELCGSAGSGPYLGLCASDPGTLLAQFYLPLGTEPFHFLQSAAVQSFGPFTVPSGITVDALAFDFTSGILGCVSTVQRFTVQ